MMLKKYELQAKGEHFILGVDEYFYFCKIIKHHTPQIMLHKQLKGIIKYDIIY